jgi:hypothetical protein
MVWYYDDGSKWNWAVAVDNVCFYTKTGIPNDFGTMTTTPISYQKMSNAASRNNWGYVNWHQATANDSILIQIEYNNSGVWNLIPDIDLPNNSTGIFGASEYSSFSLQSIDTTVYDSIRAIVSFYRKAVKSSTEPQLYELEVGSSADQITAIEEINVSAEMTDAGVLIKWRTPVNIFSSFEIEKREGSKEFEFVKAVKNRDSYLDKTCKQKSEYTYKITGAKKNGEKIILGFVKVFTNMLPQKFMLKTPNPTVFNNDFNISFDVPTKSQVEITLIDATGRVCMNLVNKVLTPGTYNQSINTSGLSNGNYFIMMKSLDFVSVKKILRIK